jgi:hypothetical protein
VPTAVDHAGAEDHHGDRHGRRHARRASGTTVELLAYSRPARSSRRAHPHRRQRRPRLAAVKPPTNTRLYAQQVGCAAAPQVVLNVRTLLTLAVERNAPRDYTFSGRACPAARAASSSASTG